MNRKPKKLIMISLDTFRADVAYSGKLKTLNTLIKQGTVFRNVVASAPITPISHASIMTGLQPYEHGIRHLFREQLNSDKATLAELFQQSGYTTGAIVSCPGLNKWYGIDAGFGHYDDEIPKLSDGSDPLKTIDVKLRGTALKRAPLVVDRALEWVKNHQHEDFFLFVHFFDTHWPYDPPEDFGPKDANPYEKEAHYMDHYLGVFLETLKENGILDEAILVVFSDHGEDLNGWYENDHGGELLGHPEEEGHGSLLFDATQMVPLIFIAPEKIQAGRMVDTQVRLVDIAPTILELFDIEDVSPRSGETLSPLFIEEGRDRIAYCETYYREEIKFNGTKTPKLGPLQAIRLENRYKIITDLSEQITYVYDLINDPFEKSPIIGEENSRISCLEPVA